MKGIITIIKIFAFLCVVAVIGALVLFLNKFQEDFNDPKGSRPEAFGGNYRGE